MKARLPYCVISIRTPVATLLFCLLFILPVTGAVSFDAAPTEGEAPLGVQFTDRSSVDGWSGTITYRWDFDDGSSSAESNPFHWFSTPDTYTARLTVRHLTGDPDTGTHWVEETAQRTITVQSPVTASFSYEITGPLTAQFRGRSTGAANIWRWDFGDGATSTIQDPVHMYRAAGPYTVRLTASTSGDPVEHIPVYSDTDEQIITVDPPLPDPPIADFSFLPTNGTAPLTVQFTDLSTGADTWQWNFGDDSTSTMRSPSHTFEDPDTYTISLTVANDGGNDSVTKTVVVGIPTTTPTTSITTITTTPTTPPITTPTVPTTTTTTPPTTTVPITSPSTAPPPPGSPPAAAFTWAPAATNGLKVQFTDGSSGEVTSWRWEFGDGNVSLERNPFHIYPGPGEFPVRLGIEGPGGASSASHTIAIAEAATPLPTPTVTPTTPAPTVTVTTAGPNATDGGENEPFPWWLAAIGAVGLLAGGAAYATLAHGALTAREPPFPGLTVEPRGRLHRAGMGAQPEREAQIEIQVRGGMRRER